MAVITNTGFVITDAGNAAATTATPAGPFIHITEFRVGSAFNYVPTGADTALHGTTMYTGGITNYYVVAYDTIELILFMDATVGPFEFGEIGIYLADGTLFALCSWSELLSKERDIGTQAGTQYRIRARLKLAQASVVCQIDVITSMQVLEVASWPLLVTPANQVGNANMAIVHEQTPHGDSVLVFKDDNNTWSINDYVEVFKGNTADGGGAAINISSIVHPDMSVAYFDLPRTDSRYLIKFPDGDIRRVTSQPNATTLNFTPAKAVPQTGEYSVWEEAQSACCRAAWVSRFEYNKFVTDFNPLWVVPTGTYSANNEGLNQTPLPLLTAPAIPSMKDWNRLHDAVIAKCKIHQVPFSDIEYTDYAYCKNNPLGWGLKTIAEKFTILEGKIAALITNRNVSDPVYQDADIPLTGIATRLLLWTANKTHTVSFVYIDDNHYKGLVNGGHRLLFAASVASGSNANWLGLKGFYAAIGTVGIGRGATSATGAGTGSAIGLYQLTPSYQQVFTHSATIAGGLCSLTINARKNGNLVEVQLVYGNTGTGYYLSGVSDVMTSQASMRRPAAAVIKTPVLIYPTVTSTSDF